MAKPRRWRLCGLASLLVVVGQVPLSAQITYTVFPANPAGGPLASEQQPADHGSARQVTLAVSDSTIGYVITTLVHQAHLRLVYYSDNPILAKRITVRIKETNVMNALAAVLKGTDVVATLARDDETVVVRTLADRVADNARRASGTIVGRVTDSASGAGLGGAAVRVDGTKVSAVTSDSGNFTLQDVPVGEQVLVVKLFGYKPAERTVTVVDGERTTVRITMVSVPTVLSGVVTTATGQQKKIAVGNDITALNVDSIMRVAPITSVTDLLETRVPGLTVLHSSGVPGDPSRIRLRGVSSISGNNDPIIIVDGIRVYSSQSDPRNNNLAQARIGGNSNDNVSLNAETQSRNNTIVSSNYAAPSPLDQIDPNTIEKIEVFKGPSASALYGSDAANGVIVIATKHGRAGPTHWNVALGQGVNWLPGAWPNNYYRFGRDVNYINGFSVFNSTTNGEHICHALTDPTCVVDSLVPFQALNDPRYSVFSHGSGQTASLTVSGGVPTLQYSVTGSWGGTIGNLKLPVSEQHRYDSLYGSVPTDLLRPDRYQTGGVNGSVTAQPTPAARVTLQSSLLNGTQQQGSLQGAILQLEGEYLSPAILGHAPLIAKDEERAVDNALTSTNALSLHWQVEPWLPIDASGGINSIQRTDHAYIPYGVYYEGYSFNGTNSFDTVANDPNSNAGYYSFGHGTSHNQTFMVGTNIPLFRQLTLALGGNLFSQSTSDVSTATNQLAPGVSVPTSFVTCSGTESQNKIFNSTCVNSQTLLATTSQSTYGVYLQTQLHVLGSLYLNPGFRLDGGSGGTHTTSTGVSNGGLSAFPKIDLSYVLVDRPGERPLWGLLTQLRPRLAFGLAGTQPDPAAKLRLFGDTTIAVGVSTFLPAVTLSSLGNTVLRPETSRELEGGFDAGLWHERLTLTYTQYNKTRFNAIIPLQIAPSVIGAIPSREVNIGEVRNTGTELTVTLIPYQSRAVSWNVVGNLSNNNNVVVKLAPGFVPNEALGVVRGYPLFSQWAKPVTSFADLNHDGIIEYNEYQVSDSNVYVGQSEPKYQFNFTTGLTLLNGRLSVNAGFDYTNGLTQNNLAAVTSGVMNFITDAPGSTLGTMAAVQAATCNAGSLNTTTGLLANPTGCQTITNIGFYQTVNTFRFNSLSINYILPGTVTRWLRVPHASVALQGSNLGLHTNYRGIDPNVNSFSTVSGGDQTADVGQLPTPRTWWLKLNLGNN